ncbi:hypothetical protein RvY_13726 [Ramazzottius varieornatus]|uniref:Uncharacterized protein n=1 Tax=Ramazzottius varieornatus TaxID=947166 RepID=A0A1D1VXE3_RAMVA|nr:hypothetical protein RvY_13726 [Ramazzottius varieornatus]
MVGSLQLASAVGQSPKPRDTLAEYLDYLHYLVIRPKDYLMQSVLLSDDEYRRNMTFYRKSFSDQALCDQIASQFFISANQYKSGSPTNTISIGRY